MNNLKKFTTEAEYEAAIGSFEYPNVSWVTSGDTLHYDLEAPTFQGKWLATYEDSSTSSAECDSTSAINQNEIAKTGLKTVEIGDCVTNIEEGAFLEYTSLSSITIPDSITYIGPEAFYGCSSLASITIPSGVLGIANNLVGECTSLTSITIPDSVMVIGNGAFEGCSSLSSIEFPSGVTSIGNYVLSNCENLTALTVNAITPPSLTRQTFSQADEYTIYVPAESVDTYKAASRWSSFADRIQAIP